MDELIELLEYTIGEIQQIDTDALRESLPERSGARRAAIKISLDRMRYAKRILEKLRTDPYELRRLAEVADDLLDAEEEAARERAAAEVRP